MAGPQVSRGVTSRMTKALQRVAVAERADGNEAARVLRRRASVGSEDRRVLAAVPELEGRSRREHVILVFEAHAEREQDLALGVHAAVHALLDTVDRAKGDLGLPRELGLRH